MEPLLSNYRNLFKVISNKWIEYAYREVNQYVDALVKMGTSNNFSFVVFVEPQPVVGTLLAFDKANMFCNRLTNSNMVVYPFITKGKNKYEQRSP